MTAINKKTPAMARSPKGSPTGSTATRIPSRTKKTNPNTAAPPATASEIMKPTESASLLGPRNDVVL